MHETGYGMSYPLQPEYSGWVEQALGCCHGWAWHQCVAIAGKMTFLLGTLRMVCVFLSGI